MNEKPPGWLVGLCFAAAAVAMAAGVFFAGTDHLPVAMAATLAFVILGGVGFELARRRSV